MGLLPGEKPRGTPAVMGYSRFVEVGRVVLVNRGPDEGKIAVIVDVVDQQRALVDGPESGVKRQALNFKNISLTDFKVELGYGARTGRVSKAFKEAGIADKWAATAWAKKRAMRVKRASLNDFDRFVVKVNKQKRARIVNKELNKLKKASK